MSNKLLIRNEGFKIPPNINRGICRHNKTKLLPNSNCLLRKAKWNEMKSSIPNFISTFVCCAGLVQASGERVKAWPIVNLVLLFSTVDFSVVIVTNFNITRLKISLSLLLTLTLSSVTYFLMHRTRKRLSILLLKLQCLPPSAEERAFNLLMLVIFLSPVALTTTNTVLCDKKTLSAKYAYGKESESHWVQMLVIFKQFVYLFTYPTFPCLIAVLYCTICVRCSNSIRNLTRKISACSLEQFAPSQQIRALRYEAKIDEILKLTQEIFSVPSFCWIVANSISCYITLGKYLMYNLKAFQLIETTYIGIGSFLCLTGTLWTAGTLHVELNNLKDTFYGKAYLRWISFRFHPEQNSRREILDKPDFAFTGCDIISYKRSTIFAIMGTLITYTALIKNMS
ncbi:uncharacterized protein TNIN_95041 [Trichonephila inaurata madagascariensis]|uniref:Gustatory receptor n=1 Tax=Trichonephila inaurata madagascariensis TaxID=2747483 RepID=A0A8X6XBT2_9ARAC|nr:uncharacterized protein TNIN_95041 [Trichonephila inaurata madagascariensis]